MSDQVPPQSDEDTGAIASILDRVLAEREARLEATGTIDLAVPTWDGQMVATYGHLSEEAFDRFVARLGSDQSASLAQAQDVLIASARAISLVDPAGGQRTQIATGYNRKLAHHLAEVRDEATAREIVLYMMGGRAMNVAEHAGEVIAFLQGSAEQVERHLTGESATS